MRVVGFLSVVVAGGAGLAWASGPPMAVSPGGAPQATRIASPCPTFSWTKAVDAERYELLVLALDEDQDESAEVLRRTLPAGATSWTPGLDECLARGGSYAWSVRAESVEGASGWSAPSLFEVATGPSEAEFEEAVGVIRRYVEEGASGGGGGGFRGGGAPKAGSPIPADLAVGSAGPAALASVAGDSAMLVNGAPVVTAATLGTGMCLIVDYRFIDQGDGTVLDCNTGKIWLKHASCLSDGTWDDTEPFDAGSVHAKVANLNSGTDYGCTDYTPGTYSDWQVPAMEDLCGQWDGSCGGTTCCTASEGLVDTGFSSPALGNAAGDGNWAAGDAFAGVLSFPYWSATELNPTTAFFVTFLNGLVGGGSKTTLRYVWPVRGLP